VPARLQGALEGGQVVLAFVGLGEEVVDGAVVPEGVAAGGVQVKDVLPAGPSRSRTTCSAVVERSIAVRS